MVSPDDQKRKDERKKRLQAEKEARELRQEKREVESGKFKVSTPEGGEGKTVSKKQQTQAKREVGTVTQAKKIRAKETQKLTEAVQDVQQATEPQADIQVSEQQPIIQEPQRALLTQADIDAGLTQEDLDAGLTSASVGGASPVGAGDILSAAGGVGLAKAAVAGGAAAAVGFKVGTSKFANPQRAVQAANAVKSTKALSPLLSGLKKYGALVGSVALGGGIVGTISSILNKIPEQQQALNTIGQIATTIEGDSLSSAGDYRKGLQELNFIEGQLLELERGIKNGSIRSPTIRYNGKILDINADIQDQLSTIAESKRAIQSFALEGQFPEMTPFELQTQLRQLESEGLIKPVDLTTSRR